MHLGRAPPSASLTAAPRCGHRRRALRVLAAKKHSSPWSSDGPKRGKGGGNSSSSNNNRKDAGGGGSGKPYGSGSPLSNNSKPSSGGSSSNPWKDAPARQGLPAKPSKGASKGSAGGSGFSAASGGGSGSNGSKNASPGATATGSAGRGGSSRLAAAPRETTVTEPINVTLLDELGPTESAAQPKWGTFCSHLNGEWVGQYAAYTPWEGKPEPAWLDERGKYINVVYTRALEHRQLYPQSPASSSSALAQEGGPEASSSGDSSSGGVDGREEAAAADVLLRKMGRCTKLSALASLRLPPEGSSSASSASALPRTPPLGSPQQQQQPAQGQVGSSSAVGGGGSPVVAGSGALGQQGQHQGTEEGVQQQQQEEEEEEEEDGDLGGSGDVDVEALTFNSDGVVVFDGGNYSAGPEYIGQQPVKLVDDAALRDANQQPDHDDDDDDTTAFDDDNEDPDHQDQDEDEAAVYDNNADASGPSSSLEDASLEDEESSDSDSLSVLPTSTTSVFETCLVDWGSRSRMRAKLTLRIGRLPHGEMDVEVLRLLLFRESWLGPATAALLSCDVAEVRGLEQPCTELPRPTPAQLQGSWNVFTMSATGFDEQDPFTGEESLSWAYTAGEEQQLWDASSRPPAGDDGASFWLPGGVVLSLRMMDNYVPADMDPNSESETESRSEGASLSDAEGSIGAALNGLGSSKQRSSGGKGGKEQQQQGAEEKGERAYPRGLCISMAWLLKEGNVAMLEREYDGYGYVREVRFSQAVKGGWSGGRM